MRFASLAAPKQPQCAGPTQKQEAGKASPAPRRAPRANQSPRQRFPAPRRAMRTPGRALHRPRPNPIPSLDVARPDASSPSQAEATNHWIPPGRARHGCRTSGRGCCATSSKSTASGPSAARAPLRWRCCPWAPRKVRRGIRGLAGDPRRGPAAANGVATRAAGVFSPVVGRPVQIALARVLGVSLQSARLTTRVPGGAIHPGLRVVFSAGSL
jgi:hypothetical protein